MTQETKLTEPVQVGLWYETKAGAIVKIEKHIENHIFAANNKIDYLPNGEGYSDYNDNNDLIRCLGADHFKQVDISKTETTTPTQFERIFTAVLGRQVANVLPIDDDHIKNMVSGAIKLTQEAIKQLKEIGE